MTHLCKGMDSSCLRFPEVSLILKGRKHQDNVGKTLEQKPARVAVTLKMLNYQKRSILETKWKEETKLRIWLICCLMFNGSLKVHEVLGKTKKSLTL